MAPFTRAVQNATAASAVVKQTHPIRILIAEDHLIARLGVSTIVNEQPDMTVVAQATNGHQAVQLYRKYQPDLSLIDMFMPLLNGFDAIAAIRTEFPAARLVALSTYSGEEDIRRAFDAGVQSYLTKDVLDDELIQAIRAVHNGQKYIPPTIAKALAAQLPRPHLSVRELDVLNAIVQGQSNKQIAYSLGICEDTVKHHVKNILSKLGVADRTQAATVAILRGIIHLHQ
jgi:two-component system, NarL family, response regulator